MYVFFYYFYFNKVCLMTGHALRRGHWLSACNNNNNFIEVSKCIVLWTNWGHKSKRTQEIDRTIYNRG